MNYALQWLSGILWRMLVLFLPLSCLSANEQADPTLSAAVSEWFSIESITVTATKQNTDLLKTPISILAFEMEHELSGRFERMSDVASQVPGLTIGNTGNSAYPAIFLRGVGTADPSVGAEPSIGFYIDDVYIGRGMAMFTDLFDLERIAVSYTHLTLPTKRIV